MAKTGKKRPPYLPPKFKQVPLGLPQRVTLGAGTRFVRVHDMTYPTTSFNPTLKPLEQRRDVGRFDAYARRPAATYYLALPDSAEELAFWETQHSQLRYPKTHHKPVVFRSKLRNRAFVTVELTESVELIDLRSLTALGAFGTQPKIINGDNRPRTRAWGAYIRHHTPTSHGFIYSSSGAGSGTEGDAAVLFDPVANASFLRANGAPEPLSHGPGLIKVKALVRAASARLL